MQKQKRRRRETKQDKQKAQKIVIDEGSLIPALKEDAGYLAKVYNQRLQKQRKQLEQKMKKPLPQTRAGGVYIPPHKLRELQNQLMQNPSESQHQKLMWQLLRKSINGIINKVNIANIQNVVIQLLNENILRGKGLLARSIIKAQMASPNFTHVYAALIAVINTKLPQIVHLIIRRVILQFQRSYARNNKIVCMATTKMLAHLINQKVLGDYAGLQLLLVMLESPTEDSVQIACDFMIEAGQVLTELTPAGANAIFERFKNILHQGEIQQKVQYSIQNLFAIRKTGFKEHPGIIPELDLVQQQDQITHNFDLQQSIDGEQKLNIFRQDPFYAKTEQQWQQIKKQILGEENILKLKEIKYYENQVQESEEEQQVINDLTEKDLINLRRTIYLTLQSTVDFEECAHKILKLGVSKGHEYELCDMIVECCMMQRIYQKFFGLLAQRFCQIDQIYKQNFIKCFVEHYQGIFKHETNKIRNLAKLFGHLFYTRAIDWKIFQIIQLTPETTTSASRTFLKILFREMAENLGIDKLHEQFNNPELKSYFQGLFPTDHPNNVRFAINYYTSIGLGKLSQELREVLQLQQKQVNMIAEQVEKIEAIKEEEVAQQQLQEQQSSSSDSSSSSSDSSDESSQSSSVEKVQKKKEADRKNQKIKQREKSRSRQKEKYQHRHGSRDRYRQRERFKQKQRYGERQKQYRDRSRQREREKSKQKERERERQRQRQRERQRQKGNRKQKQIKKSKSSQDSHSKSIDKKKRDSSKDNRRDRDKRAERRQQKRASDRQQRYRDHRKYQREIKYEQKTHKRDYYKTDKQQGRYRQKGNKHRQRSESENSQKNERKKGHRRSES